jgi:hypothetical protein
MTSTSQFFLQIASIVLISVVVWVISAIVLLTLPAIYTGGGFLIPNAPFSQSFIDGLLFGVLHGFLTGLLVHWYKSDSTLGLITSSVVATETLIAIGIFGWLAYQYFYPETGGARAAPPPFYIYLVGIGMVLIWFLIFSAILLIPSIIAGTANKLLRVSSWKLN